MPFSELKVDHALIADVVREREAMLIVQAIAKLAHTLELECVRELETREMLGFVQSNVLTAHKVVFLAVPSNRRDRAVSGTLPCS